MNVMDVTKAWFALIYTSVTTNKSGNMIIIGTQCYIIITETTGSLNFKTAKLLKLGMNYS